MRPQRNSAPRRQDRYTNIGAIDKRAKKEQRHGRHNVQVNLPTQAGFGGAIKLGQRVPVPGLELADSA
jgi:hypothetical protein